ncbi:hypothetical protein CSTERLE_08235 [Thermoclostridium stercorarium subsp. leptospartum DSM 9219]|uniref:ABC transporter permease n=1 Tax=Thermoclostridium stercorarium subsp. leptospartum DSM 9219 TaxID=1346611 RepID=A0A1B1YLC1_THEST|nr:ABC-2 family transporter protein [Thermoclostridium stercorarium]ANX01561.1 hypothetical protein CSTERLE_08235 [Thermoclostridium stercorarium subsp. leptospartum DSM 9219]
MRLYLKYLSMHVKSQMQYRTSFFMTVAGQFLTSFGVFLGIYFLMSRFHSVKDFSYNEVLLCFAVVLMSFFIAECFARGFDTFQSMLGNGEFDRILVRPRNEIFQVLASRIELTRAGRFLQAVIVFAYTIPAGGIVWSLDKILTLILMITGGVVIFSGLFLVYAALCFFTTEGLEFMNIFTDGGREFGCYPLSIYGEGILKFFTYVVPMALFQYYPLLYLTGRSDNGLYMLLPAVGSLFIIPCYILWKIGMHRYKSTGS